MLAAFMLPSASPVPTRLWTSSIKRMTLPSAFTSSTRPLMRLSNWPRNWVPATSAVKSSSWTSLSRSLAGTSPRAMRNARPSATAVLPTPGSPIRQGLFLVRRERICTTRWISFSRPMMLSSWPFRALAVKSVQKFWMCLRFSCGSSPFSAGPRRRQSRRFPRAATQHLVHRQGAAPPGANSSSPLSSLSRFISWVICSVAASSSSSVMPIFSIISLTGLIPSSLAQTRQSPWGFWLSMPLETKTTAGRFLQRVQSNIKGSFFLSIQCRAGRLPLEAVSHGGNRPSHRPGLLFNQAIMGQNVKKP